MVLKRDEDQELIELYLIFFSLDLNAAESGVQHKPTQPGRTNLASDSSSARENCQC